MELIDIDRADEPTLERERQATLNRLRNLKAECQRESQWLGRIEDRRKALLFGLMFDEKHARRAAANMLRAASLTITKRKAEQSRQTTKDNAMLHAGDVATKHGYQAVPKHIETEIDKKLDQVYGNKSLMCLAMMK